MKRTLLSIVLLLCSLSLFSEESLFSKEYAFAGGERALYNVYFNLGPIWIHAGNVEFSVKEHTSNKVDYFDFSIYGHTMRSFEKFYRIRDTFTSCVKKQGLLPLSYRETKYEDTYFCDKKYRFDWQQKGDSKVYLNLNRKGKVSYDTVSVDKGTSDLVTTCYHIRGLDMGKVTKGMNIPFKLIFDNEIYDLKLKYCGEETIKLRNKTKYKALKFKPQMITGDVFESKDAMTVYVSNDENHVPLYIEAKIKVGYVKVMLDEVSGTKTPMTSMVKK